MIYSLKQKIESQVCGHEICYMQTRKVQNDDDGEEQLRYKVSFD